MIKELVSGFYYCFHFSVHLKRRLKMFLKWHIELIDHRSIFNEMICWKDQKVDLLPRTDSYSFTALQTKTSQCVWELPSNLFSSWDILLTVQMKCKNIIALQRRAAGGKRRWSAGVRSHRSGREDAPRRDLVQVKKLSPPDGSDSVQRARSSASPWECARPFHLNLQMSRSYHWSQNTEEKLVTC